MALMNFTFEVHLENNPKTITVDTDNRDMVKFERAAHQNNWPKFDLHAMSNGQLPMFAMTFLAYSAMRRKKLYKDSFDKFAEEDCVSVDFAKTDDDEVDETARPTLSVVEAA